MSLETFVVVLEDPSSRVVPPAWLLRNLGLVLLEAWPGTLTLMNNGAAADPHWALRTRELVRRLKLNTTEVRFESARERRLRQARQRDAVGVR